MMKINSNLPFSSRIEFVPRSKFIYRNLNIPQAEGSWSVDDTVTACNAGTEGAYVCNAGGVQNQNKVFLFHLHPEYANLDKFKKVEEKFEQEINSLKFPNKKLNGLLTGGNISNFSNVPESRILRKKLHNFLSDLGVNMSIIWGRKDDKSTSICYSTKKDTWTISSMGGSRIKTVEDLKNTYKYIKISDNDQLFIQGRLWGKMKEVKKAEYPELFA